MTVTYFDRLVENARAGLARFHAEDEHRPLEGEGSSAWRAGAFAQSIESLLLVIDAQGGVKS